MESDAMKSPLMEEDLATPAKTEAPESELPEAEGAATTPGPSPSASVHFTAPATDKNEAAVEGESSYNLTRDDSSYDPTREDSLHQDSEREHSYHGFDYRTKHGANVTFSDDDNFQLSRLVRRDLPFAQSRNRVHVGHNHGWKIWRLLRHDWFHVILRYPPGLSLFVLLSLWTFFVIVFAFLYVEVDNRDPNVDCGLGIVGDPINFGQAFAFSLETTTTVGYGLPNGSNAFFENCPELQIVIYFQMLFSMLFNAFLFAFFYSQVASPDNRGAQILFSNKAIVSIVDGQVRFQVRVFDIDASNPVVEAHIRLYVVTKSRPVPRPMRLHQPNDELHSMLFLSLPYVVSHHIDIYSLLHPPRNAPVNPSGLLLRQNDSYTASREEYSCPICGESYCSEKQYRNHIRYMVELETEEEFPVTGTHLSIAKSEYADPTVKSRFAPTTDISELKEHFLQEISEIVCVVEGIEPISSGTFAGLHSYTFDEIVFKAEASFSPCCRAVEETSNKKNPTGYVSVDLDRFHDIDNL